MSEYRARHAKVLVPERTPGFGCGVCGKSDPQKPMCFKGVPWCSELHRKVIYGEMSREEADKAMRGEVVRESDVMR